MHRMFPRGWCGAVIGLAAAIVLMATIPAGAAELKSEYKLQVNVGPTFYWGMGATKFAELVTQKTGGKVTVKPYFGSSLLKGAQLNVAQMVAKGVIDCAMESTINISPVIPESNVFHLPFFLNNFENLDKVKNGQAGKALFAAMEAKGIAPIAWAENGYRQLTNGKRLVKTPQDMAGLRVRVVGSPIFIETFRALGSDPVNMNWGDAVAGFQQGVVDGQENPVGVLIPVQIWQYQKYATFWNYMVDPLIFFWNKEQWEAFPAEIRQAIQSAAVEAGRWETALCRAGLDDGKSLKIFKEEFNFTPEYPDPVKFMESKGMEIAFLNDGQVKAFADATRSVFDKWVKDIGPALVDKARTDMAK